MKRAPFLLFNNTSEPLPSHDYVKITATWRWMTSDKNTLFSSAKNLRSFYILGTLVPESFIFFPLHVVSWSWITSISVRPSQYPNLSITFLNSCDLTSTPLKFPTPVAMTWITHSTTICIQITSLCNQIIPPFFHALSLSNSHWTFLCSYVDFCSLGPSILFLSAAFFCSPP